MREENNVGVKGGGGGGGNERLVDVENRQEEGGERPAYIEKKISG